MPFEFLKPKSGKFSQTGTVQRYTSDVLIGDLMIKAGLVTPTQVDEAVKLAGNKHLQLGQMLIMAGHITPHGLQAAVDAQSLLRDKVVDTNFAAHCLKIACKTGEDIQSVYKKQSSRQTASITNKLGELLLEAGLVDHEQLAKSVQRSLSTGLPLGRILVLNGTLTETLLTTALEIQVRIRDGMLERAEAVALLAAHALPDAEMDETTSLRLKAVLATPPRRKGIRLGELLVLSGLLTESDVMGALEQGLVNEQPIGEVIVAQGFVSQELLNAALELQRRVDEEALEPLEAGQCLAKIHATGVGLDEAVADFAKPAEAQPETIAFDKMLTLARVISQEDIEHALEQCAKSPQILAKVLLMTNYISDAVAQAVLQCYSMLSNHFLGQDDAIVALDYYLRKSMEEKLSFGEALQQLGWSATKSLEREMKESVDVSHIKLKALISGKLVEESDQQATTGEVKDEVVPNEKNETATAVKSERGTVQLQTAKAFGALVGAAAAAGSSQARSAFAQTLAQPEARAKSKSRESQSKLKAAKSEPTPALTADSAIAAEKRSSAFARAVSHGHVQAQGQTESTSQPISSTVKEPEHPAAAHKMPAAEAASAQTPKRSSATPGTAKMTETSESLPAFGTELLQQEPLSIELNPHAQSGDQDQDTAAKHKPTEPHAEARTIETVKPPLGVDSLLTAEHGEMTPEHAEEVLRSLNHLAEGYFEQGNYDEARLLYDRILSYKQRQLGPRHSSLVPDLTNLAGILCLEKKFVEAEPFLRRVINIIENAEPSDTLKLADSLNTLAGILFQQAKFDECEPLLERSLKLRQQQLGVDHPEIANDMRDYAKLLRKLKRADEAEKMYAQAQAILAKSKKV